MLTVAILNVLLNVKAPGVQLGDELSNLQSFSKELDPETKGSLQVSYAL